MEMLNKDHRFGGFMIHIRASMLDSYRKFLINVQCETYQTARCILNKSYGTPLKSDP